MFPPDAVGVTAQQSHDFEPGIAPSGLFWTIPIASSAIYVDPRSGRARLHAGRVAVLDYHDGNNAVGFGSPPRPPLPSHVSFDVRWAGNGGRQAIRDQQFGFTGEYVTSQTTIDFTTSVDGVRVIYRADPRGQYNVPTEDGGAGPPAVGLERNGVFFR